MFRGTLRNSVVDPTFTVAPISPVTESCLGDTEMLIELGISTSTFVSVCPLCPVTLRLVLSGAENPPFAIAP